MVATAVSVPHDSAYLSIAKDGDVMIVTAPVGLAEGDALRVRVEDGRLKVRQRGTLFLDVEIGPREAAQVEDAGSVIVVEVFPGPTPDDDEHVVHRLVSKGE